MKYLKIAFGLVFVAGLMAVTASTAMAGPPKYVHCVKGNGWMSGCKAVGSGWETKSLTGTETSEVTSSGTLELEDDKQGVTITCTGTNKGWVGANGTGAITSITATSCSFVAKKHGECEESKGVKANALHLPWNTKLEERNGTEVRSTLENSGKGEPGWNVECTVGGIFKIQNECTGKTTTGMHNNFGGSEALIEATFDERTKEEPMAKCSIDGGEAVGLVRGTITFKLASPNTSGGWILAEAFKT